VPSRPRGLELQYSNFWVRVGAASCSPHRSGGELTGPSGNRSAVHFPQTRRSMASTAVEAPSWSGSDAQLWRKTPRRPHSAATRCPDSYARARVPDQVRPRAIDPSPTRRRTRSRSPAGQRSHTPARLAPPHLPGNPPGPACRSCGRGTSRETRRSRSRHGFGDVPSRARCLFQPTLTARIEGIGLIRTAS